MMSTFDQQLYNKMEFQQQLPPQQSISSLQLPNPLQATTTTISSYNNNNTMNYPQQSNNNLQQQIHYQQQIQRQQHQINMQHQQGFPQPNSFYNLPPPSNSFWDLKYSSSSNNSSNNSTAPLTPNLSTVNTPVNNPSSLISSSVPSSSSISTMSSSGDSQYTFTNQQSLGLSQYSLPSITSLKSDMTPKVSSKSKPRKKKQCPICQQYFSNLSTHKSIHLSPANRPFLCKFCNRGFARSNDLFRHNKRHWKENGLEEGTFKCPYSSVLNEKYHNEKSDDLQPCHPTGVFSRCDTYKNHLKALHFQYPPGTKKLLRHKSFGNCKKCGMYFGNVQEWLDSHVSKGTCGFIYPEEQSQEEEHENIGKFETINETKATN